MLIYIKANPSTTANILDGQVWLSTSCPVVVIWTSRTHKTMYLLSRVCIPSHTRESESVYNCTCILYMYMYSCTHYIHETYMYIVHVRFSDYLLLSFMLKATDMASRKSVNKNTINITGAYNTKILQHVHYWQPTNLLIYFRSCCVRSCLSLQYTYSTVRGDVM